MKISLEPFSKTHLTALVIGCVPWGIILNGITGIPALMVVGLIFQWCGLGFLLYVLYRQIKGMKHG